MYLLNGEVSEALDQILGCLGQFVLGLGNDQLKWSLLFWSVLGTQCVWAIGISNLKSADWFGRGLVLHLVGSKRGFDQMRRRLLIWKVLNGRGWFIGLFSIFNFRLNFLFFKFLLILVELVSIVIHRETQKVDVLVKLPSLSMGLLTSLYLFSVDLNLIYTGNDFLGSFLVDWFFLLWWVFGLLILSSQLFLEPDQLSIAIVNPSYAPLTNELSKEVIPTSLHNVHLLYGPSV